MRCALLGFLGLPVLVLAACHSDPALPPEICMALGPGPYPLTFSDVTAAMTMPDVAPVAGSNLVVADINGDHWPDLSVSDGASDREKLEKLRGLYRVLVNNAGVFSDVTWTTNLFVSRNGNPGRSSTFIVFGDVDNDGDQDAFSAVSLDDERFFAGQDLSTVFLNNGDGTFTMTPEQYFTSGNSDPVASAAFFDYDHDGRLDLFVGHSYGTYGYLESAVQDSLYQGQGNGLFTDVTDPAGLTTQPVTLETLAAGTNHKPTWGVSACDLNDDGWDDLVTASYGRQFNMTYLNRNGTFEDLSMTSGIACDDDLTYTDNMMFICYCTVHSDSVCDGIPNPPYACKGGTGASAYDYTNEWTVGFDDQPFRLVGDTSNALCGDLDNDGDLDLVLVALKHKWAGVSADHTEILRNDGFPEVPFVRPGNDVTGLTRVHHGDWDEGDLSGAVADLDNDGRLDVMVMSSDYPDTTSVLWQQQADGTFKDVAWESGALLPRAHGIAVVDFDRDGDYDLVMGTSLARWYSSDDPPRPADNFVYFVRNNTGQSVNRVMVHLEGAGGEGGANRDAIGARVQVRVGSTTYTRYRQGSYGLSGIQSDPLMIIGIGDACSVDEVTVRWPDANLTVERFTAVRPNYVLYIKQGEGLRHMTLEEYAPR
jgi:enediyne biosynthesis protein E4